MGSIVTFYSFKGGVGRTMALANIAVLLARRGLRVLAVDWDLEAPGLDRYFRNYSREGNGTQAGLLDLLIDRSTQVQQSDWRNYTTKILFNDQVSLTLLTSGRQDESYASRVLRFDWNEFFTNCDGGNVIEAFRDDWKEEFDVTLIDSRTGITDAGGICTIQLPDILVPVFTTNEQSLQGAKDIVLRAQAARQKLAFDRMPLLVFPLPSRFEGLTEYEEAKNWLNIFSKELAQFYEDWLPKQFSSLQILERTKLPYVAYFSFGEKLPVVTEGTSDPQSLGYAYLAAANLIGSDFRDAEGLISGGPLLSGASTQEIEWTEKDRLSLREAQTTPLSVQEFFNSSKSLTTKPLNLVAHFEKSRIRILFTTVSPPEDLKTQLSSRMRQIFASLQKGESRDNYEFITEIASTPSDLQAALLRHKPHIVHLLGRGNHVKEHTFEDSSLKESFINEEALAELFRIFRDDVQVLIFDGYCSKSQAERSAEFINYVVHINDSIGDEASTIFIASFYSALEFGRSVEDAFSLAQNALDLSSVTSSHFPSLLVRNRPSSAAPFLVLVNSSYQLFIEHLKSVLERITAGTSDEEERETIKQALLDGKIIFNPKDTLIAETFPEEGFNLIPHDKLLEIELSTTAYSRLQEQLFPPLVGLAPPSPGLIFIGRQDSLKTVKELLRSAATSQIDRQVLVVRGWPGVGKTAFVGVIGRDPEVLQRFPDGVLWTSLGQQPDLMSVLATWGRALGTDELLRVPTLSEAIAKLAVLLRDRRMLLIVDDVWDETHTIPFLTAGAHSRSALIITTRITSLAEALIHHPATVYVLPPLAEDEAFTLLRVLAPTQVDQYPDECRELVRNLEYIPLALHVAGRLIRTESLMGLDVNYLIQEMKESNKLFLEPAPLDMSVSSTIPTVAALLQSSVNVLDAQTRECFAYLGAFAPKPATFDLASMAAVWQVKDPIPVVRKLVAHGLLEPVGSGRFHMNSLIVDYARSLLT